MDLKARLITGELIRSVLEEARRSRRKRKNFNFHASHADNPHRFLNVMLEGTYIAPHRHLHPPKSETFLVLEGRAACFVFDDAGRIEAAHILGGDVRGIDILPGVWHTLSVLTPHAVCFEVKPGPYSPEDDKEFATWAPREGDGASGAYLEGLLRTLNLPR
jgi:cupin fold WbuC family metalloprotein